MSKKILILGGSGFIGSHLLKRIADGSSEVICFSRTAPQISKNHSQFSWIKGDFTHTDDLRRALKGVDIVVHCICGGVPSTSQNDPVSAIYEDLIPTVNLLQEMDKQNIKQLLFLSSGGAVYGNQPNHSGDEHQGVDEQTVVSPISYYGALKTACESFLLSAARSQQLNCTIIRPSNIYGTNSRWINQLGFIHTLIDNQLNKKTTGIFGDGEIIRDYLYVSDLVDLLEKMISTPVPGIYNAGSGIGYSLNGIVNRVESITNEKLALTYKDARKYDVHKIVLNSGLANKTFHWYPKVDLDSGIKKILRDKSDVWG